MRLAAVRAAFVGRARRGDAEVDLAQGRVGNLQGGDQLEVSFSDANGEFDNVRLTGPADFVFTGKIEI